MPTADSAAKSPGSEGNHSLRRFSTAGQLDKVAYRLLLLGAVCQIATVAITWSLWQVRTTVPHLPTFDLPQVPFGWLMVGTAALVAIRPREGMIAHWVVLAVASTLDQFRLQPQFFAIAVLMTACVWPWGQICARWFIASIWFWSGLHKWLSPDWWGHTSHGILSRTSLDVDAVHLPFIVTIALSELVLGILACVRPRWAAIACVPLHLGVIVFLSPLGIDWNVSVIPWNLSMAAIGFWVMWHTAQWRPSRAWEIAVCAVCMIAPVGFFNGWLDHGFASVLYSGHLPRGLITSKDGVHRIRGWGELRVPFPNERRTLRIYFEQYARPGDKLHVADPRAWLDDQYYVLDADRQAQPISIDTFLMPQPQIPSVAGIGIDQRRTIFAFQRSGVRMLRAARHQPIYAVEFTPQSFSPELFAQISGLPNLTQIQLSGTSVQDHDLRHLQGHRLLVGIGLDQTAITDAGLKQLHDLPRLQYIECEGTKISPRGLAEVLKTPVAAEP